MKCEDKHCPVHGNISVRGRIFKGNVIKSNPKTVQIEFIILKQIPKYQRFEKRRSRINAHVPPCMNIKIGDRIIIQECKPISKTKNFVVIKNESNKS